jgi:hypothetical protein
MVHGSQFTVHSIGTDISLWGLRIVNSGFRE